ncbi:MAG: flagellar hook-length control protein FliK, partial [Pseudomonadota bacterium]
VPLPPEAARNQAPPATPGTATSTGALDLADGPTSAGTNQGSMVPSKALSVSQGEQLASARTAPMVAEAIARKADATVPSPPLPAQSDPVRVSRAILSATTHETAGKPLYGARLDGNASGPPPQVIRRETHLPVTHRMDPTQPPSRALSDALTVATPSAQGQSTASPASWYSFDRIAPQVFAALSGGSAIAADPSSARTAPQPSVTPSMAMGPTKVIEIALQPVTLGTLTVTMRLSPSGLKVSVGASERETARALAEDSAAMAELVTSAGYEVEEIHIAFAPTTVAGETAHAPPNHHPADTPVEAANPTQHRPSPSSERNAAARSITV